MSGSITGTATSLGVIKLVWGGTTINVDSKAASFNRGGLVATAVVAGNQISQSLNTVAPKVTAKFPLLKGMSIDGLKALNGSELQIECDTGQKYVMNGAFLVGDPKITGGPGSNVSADWSGQPALEVLP